MAGIAFNLIIARIDSSTASRARTQATHKVKFMPLLAAVFHVHRDTTGEWAEPTNTDREGNDIMNGVGLFVSLEPSRAPI